MSYIQKSVLIVEDNEISSMYFELVFKKREIPSFITHDAKSAIDIFTEHKDNIAFFFSDILLPDMTGYDLATEIFKIKKVPIILQSALNPKTEKDKALKFGITDYYSKPINLKVIDEIINKYF